MMVPELKKNVPRRLKVILISIVTWRYRRVNATGVYYFMPGDVVHIQHLLPLFKAIGGTVVVTSDQVKKDLETREIACIAIDKVSVRDPSHLTEINVKKTIDFLNKKADVVIMYDIVSFAALIKPRTLFIPHGVSLAKQNQYWSANDRIKNISKYDYIVGGDRYSKKILITKGIESAKILDITTTRSSEIIRGSHIFPTIKKYITRSRYGFGPRDKIIAYMPSLYTQTSVNDTGISIVRNLKMGMYKVVFWPHPHTDKAVIDEYRSLADGKKVIVGSDSTYDLPSLYKLADVFICDPATSVVSDVVLTEKPILFSYGASDYDSHVSLPHDKLRDLVATSLRVDHDNAESINEIVGTALKRKGINKAYYLRYIYAVFFNPNGSALDRTVDFIRSSLAENKHP